MSEIESRGHEGVSTRMTDPQLLSKYVETRSDAAFEQLVRRYVDLVYSAARRMVRDEHLAEDVTQAVFIVLSRKAPRLLSHPALSGWLYSTTRLTARNALRETARRARRELASARSDMSTTSEDSEAQPWEQIAPQLDDAMASLSERDRALIVWRYFENRSHAQTASLLGTSENTANRRLLRAVEKLKQALTRRGVAVPMAAITGGIAARAVQAAPAQVAGAIASPSAVATSLAGGTITALALIQAKLIGIALVVLAVVVGATVTAQSLLKPPPAPPAPAPPVQQAVKPNPGTGATQLIHFCLLGKPQLLDALRARATGTTDPKEKDGFATLTLPSTAFDEVMSARSGDIVTTSRLAEFCRPQAGGRDWIDLSFERGKSADESDDRVITFNGRGDLRADLRRARVDLQVDSPGVMVGVIEPTDQPAIRQRQVSLNLSTTLTPGTTLVASVNLDPKRDDLRALVVLQTVQATPQRMQLIEQREIPTRQWLTRGLDGLVADADDGIAWQARAHPPIVDEKWRRKLSDETTLSLVAVGRSREHPYRWWDGSGKPVTNDVYLDSLRDEFDLQIIYSLSLVPMGAMMSAAQVSHRQDSPFDHRVGVSLGGWREVGKAKVGGSVADDSRRITITKLNPAGEGSWCEWTRPVSDDVEYELVPESADGRRIGANLPTQPRFHFATAGASEGTTQPMTTHVPMPSDQLAYVVVMKRETVWTTFENIAAAPDLSTPAPVKASDAAPRVLPPAGTPERCVDDLLTALTDGNADKARALVDVTPDTASLVDAGIAYAIAANRLHSAAVASFGAAEVSRALPELATASVEIPATARAIQWKVQADRATPKTDGFPVELVRREGGWKVSLAPLASAGMSNAEAVLYLQSRALSLRAALDGVRSGKYADAYELRDALNAPPVPTTKPS